MVGEIGTLRRGTFGCMLKQSAQSIVHIRQIETAVTALLYKETQGDIMERIEKMYFDYVHDHMYFTHICWMIFVDIIYIMHMILWENGDTLIHLLNCYSSL